MFQMNEEFVIKSEPTPLERQRIMDGTPHTRGGRYRITPGQVEPVGDGHPELYLGKSLSNDGDNEPIPEGAQTKKSLNPDDIVKSFLKGSYGVDPGKPTTVPPKGSRAYEKDEPKPSGKKPYQPVNPVGGERTVAKAGAWGGSTGSEAGKVSTQAAPKKKTEEETSQLATKPDPARASTRAAGVKAGKKVGRAMKTGVNIASRVVGAVASVVPTSGR